MNTDTLKLRECDVNFINSYREPWMGCMFVVKQNIQAVREKLTDLYYKSGCFQLGIKYAQFVAILVPYYTVDPSVLDKLYLDIETEKLVSSLIKKGSVSNTG